MSVQATTWVWEHSKANNAGLLVMLAIADSANREGAAAMQSIPTIARMVRTSDRHVSRCIAKLLEMGELEKTGQSLRYGTTVYRLAGMGPDPTYPTPDLEVTPDNSSSPDIGERAPLTSESSTPDPQVTQPQETTPGTTTPSSSVDDGGSSTGPSSEELFEDWWRFYPWKVARKEAAKAFDKALKSVEYPVLRAGLVSAIKTWVSQGKVTIKHDATGQIVAVTKKAGEDGKGIPHGASWLNGERWNDEESAAPAATESGEDQNSWMHRTE